ncbi:MAG: dihydrolipoyl dehydrogenase [Deltaproteobacteria bacterium]|nr:dihydrolipoyl dehydrogenase [Deltaproteobacteria bacterium]|tara:strand:- start:906 stop:2309 length:1404 start_codon:yes stop_codon:yes gene_type:complete
MKKYDIVVLGSGPGGYVAAIRCAQLGMKTALIERYPTLGGTCLNVGCIPSKALLDSSEHFYNAKHNFDDHGIKAQKIELDWPRMRQRKDEVVRQTCDGLIYLMKKNKINVLNGHGTFKDKNTITVKDKANAKQTVNTKYTIIATGSKPSSITGVNCDKKRIITSTEALSMREVPQNLIVIGGGVIGLELGSVFKRLGSNVKIVEYLDRLVSGMDISLGKEIQRILKKQGIEFFLNHSVQKAVVSGKSVEVTAKNKKDKEVKFKGDYCLVSVGRSPYTDNLGLQKLGVNVDDQGRIKVNENLETSIPGIYAIGDVIKGAMLAHKAEEEGVFVAEKIAGQKPHINYKSIPEVLYTWPEAASVGFTEEELKAENYNYSSGSFPFKALGRARVSMDTEGFVKVLADKETDEVLGIHIVGARAADLIAEAVVALEYRASSEDIARMSHAHPTYAEAIKEAMLDATGKRSLHN